jgi:tRNA-splicing endonuclease subunit Sen54
MEDIEEFEQEQTDYSLFLNKKNLTNVSKLIKGQLNNETKNEFEKQEAISISLENLKNVISDTHVVSSRNLSIAKWDYSLNLAIVTVKHGNLFETMGKVIDGQMTLFPEETLFLIEKGSLQLMEENDDGEEYPISIQQAYSIIFSIPSFTFEKYRVYSYLKRLGYIILEHDNTNLSKEENESSDEEYSEDIDNLQNNTENKNHKSLFKQLIVTNINFLTYLEEHIENSKFFSNSMQTLLKKSFSFFNKLFFIPLSLAFNLETNLKIKYFENQREKNTTFI